MNQILSRRPECKDAYLHSTPRWLMQTVRAMFVICGILAIYFVFKSSGIMHSMEKFIMGSFSAVFLAIATWPKPWSTHTKFIATPKGLYFPCNSQLVIVLGQSVLDEWLFVPWSRVRDLRLSRESGGDNAVCVAFDVEVSTEEKDRFFKHVDRPSDRRADAPGVANLAYCDYPPPQERTLLILEGFANTGKG